MSVSLYFQFRFARGNDWNMKIPAGPDPKAKDIPALDEYATERWECVLHFMVGSQQKNQPISTDAINLLQHAGLMKK